MQISTTHREFWGRARVYVYIPRTLRPSTADGGTHRSSGGKRTVGAGRGRWWSRCCPPDWRSDRHLSEGPESSESSRLTCTRPDGDVCHRHLRVHGHRPASPENDPCQQPPQTRLPWRTTKQTRCARAHTAAGSREPGATISDSESCCSG